MIKSVLDSEKSLTTNIFDQSAVATVIITPEHKVIHWNKSCEKLTGFKSSRVLNTEDHWKPFYNEKRPCLADIVVEGNYAVLPEPYDTFSESKLMPGGLHAAGWEDNLAGKNMCPNCIEKHYPKFYEFKTKK